MVNFSPEETLGKILEEDYLIETESYIRGRETIIGTPSGHNPETVPKKILPKGIFDTVQMTLNRVPKMGLLRDGQSLAEYRYFKVIIRSNAALKYHKLNNIELNNDIFYRNDPDNLDETPKYYCNKCPENSHKLNENIEHCSFTMRQMIDLNKQVREDPELEIIGTLEISQRVVYKKGNVLLQKGIIGNREENFITLGKVDAKELLI